MRKQTHKVELTSEERQTLETLVHKGEHSALKLMRAHILLKADRNGPSWTDARISEAFGCDPSKGFARWTLQLLADELVGLEVVESISLETVRQTLKKKRVTPAPAAVLGDPSR